jgi:hypothetical protein
MLWLVLTLALPLDCCYRMQREKKDEGPAWTPERDRALQTAVEWARMGRTFWTVKPPSDAVTAISTSTSTTETIELSSAS